MANTNVAPYQRQKQDGAITLRGVVDIFEASSLHAEMQRALSDVEASNISVDLARVERLDVAALQVLIAMRNDLEAAGRTFTLCNTPPAAAKMAVELGLAETI